MNKRFPKRIAIFLAAGIIGGLGSYYVGRIGVGSVNVAQAITESRCRAGAFIADADSPKNLGSDAHDEAAASTSGTESDKAGFIDRPAAALGSNLIPNPGAETLSSGNPLSWSSGRNGNNDASFSQVAGHNSGRALRIDITKYTDGTANWYTAPVSVSPGAYYEFSDYYRSNVVSRATLVLKDSAGKERYISLASMPVSTDWSAYSTRFFVPRDVQQVSVYHSLDRLGSLETDDYSLTQVAPTGFSEPLVSITFDDGWKSIHDKALPLMERYNVTSTQYIISGFLGRKDYDSPGDVYDFRDAGHEIASHTFDHKDLTTLSEKDLTRELTLPKTGLSKCFGDVTDFAAPYGSYNAGITKTARGLYQTARSTDTGFNSADQFHPYQLKVQNVGVNTSAAQIQAWLDTAKANHVWLILVYHQVDDSGSEYSRKPADFEADLQKVVASGIPVKTMRDAYAEIKPQLKP